MARNGFRRSAPVNNRESGRHACIASVLQPFLARAGRIADFLLSKWQKKTRVALRPRDALLRISFRRISDLHRMRKDKMEASILYNPSVFSAQRSTVSLLRKASTAGSRRVAEPFATDAVATITSQRSLNASASVEPGVRPATS